MLVNVLMLAAASKSLNCWGGSVGSITTTSNPDLIFAQGACGAMWYDVSDKANPHLASLPHYTKGGPSAVYLSSSYSATSDGDIVAVFYEDSDLGSSGEPLHRNYVVLYSVDTREALAAVNLSTSVGGVTDVAVHNNLLFVVGSKGLAVVNATTGTVTFSAPSDSYKYLVKVSPQAKLLYTYEESMKGRTETVTIRSLDTFARLSSFEHEGVMKILTPTGSPTEVYLFHYSLPFRQLTKVDVADPANPIVVSTSDLSFPYVADIVWTDVLVVATYTLHNVGDPPDDVRVLDPLNGFSITARSNAAVDLSYARLAVGDTGVIYCVVGLSKLVVFEQQGSDLVMSGESETSIVDPHAAMEIKPDVMAVMGAPQQHGPDREAVYIVDMHGPMPKVLATESAGRGEMCGFSREHAMLVFREIHYDPGNRTYYVVAYNVSDPAAPAPVWRKQVDLFLTSCATTEDVVVLTFEEPYSDPPYTPTVEVVDVTTGEENDTAVVDTRSIVVPSSRGSTFVVGDTFYSIQGFSVDSGAITFASLVTPAPATPATPTPDTSGTPAPATPAPVPATPAPVTPAPDTSAAGVPWLIVVGSVVFFAAAGLAGGWFLKSKMKVREVDQNSGLSDQIVNDDVQPVEFSAVNIAE